MDMVIYNVNATIMLTAIFQVDIAEKRHGHGYINLNVTIDMSQAFQ